MEFFKISHFPAYFSGASQFLKYHQVTVEQCIKPNLNANNEVVWTNQSDGNSAHFEFGWSLKF